MALILRGRPLRYLKSPQASAAGSTHISPPAMGVAFRVCIAGGDICTPCTLNPDPSTLNPERYTLKQGAPTCPRLTAHGHLATPGH